MSAVALASMERFIAGYLALSKVTVAFTTLDKADLSKLENRLIVVHGLALGLEAEKATPQELLREAARMSAVGFDTESAITAGVYRDLRAYPRRLLACPLNRRVPPYISALEIRNEVGFFQ